MLPTRELLIALAIGSVMTGVAFAQNVVPPGSDQPAPGVQMPSPLPQPTISGTPIPYPAYGTPAPDVAKLAPKKGIPQSISLDNAVRVGVALSPVFALQNAQWAAIHAKYGAAYQALYPSVSGNARIGKAYSNGTSTSTFGSGGPTSGPSPTPSPLGLVPMVSATSPVGNYSRQTVTTESATITITQLIYDGGRTIAAIRSAKEADLSGRATLLRNLQTLAFNIANAYYAVLENDATVTADAQLVHEFEVNEAVVAAQIRNGAAARSDIAAAQFQTAQARGNLITAQGNAIAAQATFATTIGLDADAAVVPKPLGPLPPQQNLSYAGSLKRALIMRPDYISAAYNVESARQNLRFAKLARFPALAAAASDGVSRTFLNCLYEQGLRARAQAALCPGPAGWSNDKALGLNLSVPIYDQGVTNYNIAVAASQVDQALATLNSTRLTVESDVRSALARLISAVAALAQARSELVSAQVSLDATQAQYRVGATTILNVVTAEANLSTAQSAYITALYGVRTAQANYLYGTGVSDVQL